MLAAGVAGKSDHDGSVYDYFRDRVMFPIENRQGRVIAFGARSLGDTQPKYLNSGEGPTFSKKQYYMDGFRLERVCDAICLWLLPRATWM